MKILEKLWKKTKFIGQEIKDVKVVDAIGKIAEEGKVLKQNPEIVSKTNEKRLKEERIERVLNLFDELCIPNVEIEKLGDAEIETIYKGLAEKFNKNWGYNSGESFLLEKQIVASWGEYDLYIAKIVRPKRAPYRCTDKENALLFENYIFATEKNGHIVGINYFKDENYDINNLGFNALDSIIFVFNDLYVFEEENINNICLQNFMLSNSFFNNGMVTLLAKDGSKQSLCVAGSNEAFKHYTFNTTYLRKNDKIIKNSLENISRDYSILLDGKMEPKNNWQLYLLNGELKGLKKKTEQNVYNKKEYDKRFKPSFDSTKNYGDILLYAQKNENGEFVIDAEEDDRRCAWNWKKVAVSPRNANKILELTVFDKVRKQEIINSKGEAEEIHFYDKNDNELVVELDLDNQKIKCENERDKEHIADCVC